MSGLLQGSEVVYSSAVCSETFVSVVGVSSIGSVTASSCIIISKVLLVVNLSPSVA